MKQTLRFVIYTTYSQFDYKGSSSKPSHLNMNGKDSIVICIRDLYVNVSILFHVDDLAGAASVHQVTGNQVAVLASRQTGLHGRIHIVLVAIERHES